MQITHHAVATVHFTLKNSSGEVLETSQGDEPLQYLHGVQQIVPGLERALEGKGPGDHVDTVVPAAEGFGEYDDDICIQVPREEFGVPEDQLLVGMPIEIENDGEVMLVTLTGYDDASVTLDANHPLAGQDLSFSVDVLAIREATPEEIEHGLAHGPDGHQDHEGA